MKHKPRLNWKHYAATLIIAVGLLACSTTAQAPVGARYTITGTFALKDVTPVTQRGERTICHSEYVGKFDLEGTAVVVKNGEGHVIGASQLGQEDSKSFKECQYPFEIADLPEVNFYQIEVGYYDIRTYSRSALTEQEWQIKFIYWP